MIPLSKFKWTIVVIVLHLIVLGYFAFSLPSDAKVPMHWNINNEIDGWSGKTTGLIFGVVMTLGMFLLLYLLPLYSPWSRNYKQRLDSFIPTISLVLVLFFALISIYSLYLAQSGVTPRFQMILVLIGLLFIFLGNLLPKAPRNFFVGIRTPWTIANEEIWQKTHRVGGKLFVLSGLIFIIKGFVLTNNYPFQQYSGALAFIILLYPLLHSFILFRKIESRKS